MTVYVATKNPGKRAELRAILAPFGWRVVVFSGYRDVIEGDASYADNAALKARALREQLAQAHGASNVLADDSGLEIAALAGRPGIHSARYGGADATWAQRRASLLAELDARPRRIRAARFVCALHFIAEGGAETTVEAALCGSIALCERGIQGFSYDPIFELADGRTLAEISADEKNRLSHRYRAATALLEALTSNGPESRRNGWKSPADGT